MNIKRLISSCALATVTILSFQASAGNIDATAARLAANNFVKQHAAAKPGSFQATALADLTLAHAEASAAVQGANDFYAFNIKGGGFVIIAGEDRATPVLGYSDKGRIDFNNLPAPLRDLLDGYREEIEFLQTYKGDDLTLNIPPVTATNGVEPLIKTTWGQEMPYYLQCPTYQGEYCVVGCVATAMAQVMYYWQYPTSCSAISSFYCSGIRQTVPGLPATTFDYSLMLESYCHWDWNTSTLIQDTYTDAQAQEVAKISRYCGQAVEMGYSPEGSGAYVSDQLAAMKQFGYSSSAKDVSKGGWYSNYTTQQWETMMKAELDAGRPILYSATDPSAGGHAFICDGYNSEGKFHYNFGWYGTCDGWYVSTSLSMTHRDGDALNFRSNHEMLTGVEPPAFCIVENTEVNASDDLVVLGESLSTAALSFSFRTTYSAINVVFALTDQNGNVVCTGDAINISKNSFEQGSTVNGNIILPADLAEGTYNVKLYYYTDNSQNLIAAGTSERQLNVVGHLAKYDTPFSIVDITEAISYVLQGDYSILSITDVTELIAYVLTH